MNTTRLILVRHGQTDSNRAHRYQGQRDVPLNDAGREQIRAAAEHLKGTRAAAIYTSDLSRCRESAAIVGAALGLEPIVAPELRERDFGELEGLTHEETAARFPDNWAQRALSRDTWVPPGGESLDQLWGRVLGFVEELWRRHEGETFVIAGHGGPMRAVILTALGASRDARGAFPLGNGSITVITRDDAGPTVGLLDETCHLGRLPDEVKTD